MANEEITISELELAENVLADMVVAVDTATDTKSVTLSQLKAWLGSSLPTGFILPAIGRISDERFTLLDGKTLARTGTYEAFCNKVIEQVQAGNWFSCTEAEFNQDVARYGQCGRFVITNDYVRIPIITRYIGATITLSEIGRTYAESLPNITGTAETAPGGDNYAFSGALRGNAILNRENTYSLSNLKTTGTLYGMQMNASWSSSTYQNGAKVNPEHTKFPYYMVVSTTGQEEQIDVDINQVYEDLALKANKDLSNTNASSTFREASVGWGLPDYNAGISITANQSFTCPKKGAIAGELSAAQGGSCGVFVNNVLIEQTGSEGSQRCRGSFFALVNKNDVVRVTTSGNATVFIPTFYPMKGV